MSCPICRHTMQNPGQKNIFHCPRCGCLKVEEMIIIPKLIEHVKDAIDSSFVFKAEGLGIYNAVYLQFWNSIKECVGKSV